MGVLVAAEPPRSWDFVEASGFERVAEHLYSEKQKWQIWMVDIDPASGISALGRAWMVSVDFWFAEAELVLVSHIAIEGLERFSSRWELQMNAFE